MSNRQSLHDVSLISVGARHLDQEWCMIHSCKESLARAETEFLNPVNSTPHSLDRGRTSDAVLHPFGAIRGSEDYNRFTPNKLVAQARSQHEFIQKSCGSLSELDPMIGL